MAGNAQGTVYCLLFLASIIQGFQDVELFHYKTVEAVVGQNITLPCILKNRTDVKLASVEWSKRIHKNRKLALYSPVYGLNLFWPNVTIQIENNTTKMTGTYLHLTEVKKWDSGIYVCELATFPLGSMQSETELTVKDDIKIMCDVDGTVEVHKGENVTIPCRLYPDPDAQYRWTKNKELVSESETLELWGVTDALAGVYTLTVNTGNKSLHKEFIITVLTATTSLRTDLVTASPQGLTESADSSLNASVTTEHSTHANWTMNMDTVNSNTSNATITAIENTTSSTQSTHISVTSPPATHSTTSSYGSKVFKSTPDMASDETKNESTIHPEDIKETSTSRNISENSEKPEAASALSAGTTIVFTEEKDATQRHLSLPLIIIPMLVLIAAAGFLYRRQMIKKRMDQPPPFKPPPPPVKYTAATRSETSTQLFPTSRCNSVAEPKDPICYYNIVALVLLSLALLVSLCLNIILCMRRRATLCRDESCYPDIPEGETLTQNEGRYFHYLNHDEQQENPHDHHEQQENPIYGNISTDSRGSAEGCYEMMTMQRKRDCKKPLEPDLNYASLDLKMAKKRKKHRHQQGHTQGRNQLQDQLPDHLTPPMNSFLEVDADVDALLPSRDTSMMVSHSSIYLNSQQIAQEAEEMERERTINMERENVGWDGMQRSEDRGSREWKEDQESKERILIQDGSNGNVCIQLSEGETIESSADHFISSQYD